MARTGAARPRDLAQQAAAASIGFNIDAEEQDRLDLSLDVIEAMLSDPDLDGWDGFGVVVQAYGRRAAAGDRLLYALAERHRPPDHGAAGQGRLLGHRDQAGAGTRRRRAFRSSPARPTPTVSYIACAQMLLDRRDRIYPQFATHNAHTVAAVLQMAGNDTAASNSSACTAWARRCTQIWSRRREGTPLPHLRAGRGAPGSAGLSRAPPAGERGQFAPSSTRSSTRTCPPRRSAARSRCARCEALATATPDPADPRSRSDCSGRTRRNSTRLPHQRARVDRCRC